MNRRTFFSGLSALAAPAIIRMPGLLMPVRRVVQYVPGWDLPMAWRGGLTPEVLVEIPNVWFVAAATGMFKFSDVGNALSWERT